MQYAKLLASTYSASGGTENPERYYTSQFASYFGAEDSHADSSTVKAILNGTQLPPRKLLRYYSDLAHPRCPESLRVDLQVLLDTCHADEQRRRALRGALERYVNDLSQTEAADLREILAEDLAQNWAVLCWHALTVDYGQAS